MNYWPVVAMAVSILGSVLGAYFAVREMLARIEERMKALSDRAERHSNRLHRLEDKYFKA